MNYLTKMTVKELREIAVRMNLENAFLWADLPKINRAKKADLVKIIAYGIEEDMVEAFLMNEAVVTVPVTWLTYQGIGNGRRTQTYIRQNGSLRKRTPKQERRINHKGNREYGYSTKNLQFVLTV